ncbi:MAG: LysM peptidoglycan-binding domain-containing protein [Eubacteriales bacterium]|nr:MAG: hypothetical protein CVV03_01145 [Firmicutes bacterium HGW-Firmicutes-8]
MKIVKRKKINLLKIIRILTITVTLAAVMMFATKSQASGLTADSYQEVTVCRGDTLWDIAKKYKGDKNIQMVIYNIMKDNKLETSGLHPGQQLIIYLKY